MLSRQDILRLRTGANPYQAGRDLRTVAAVDLERGNLVAIDDSYRLWTPVTALFFINDEGHLQLFPKDISGAYPVNSLIRRYEEMVSTFGKRPSPTDIPSGQFFWSATCHG